MDRAHTDAQQRTVARPLTCTGIGLHTGRRVVMRILPAPVNAGITFLRTDTSPHVEIPARIENVTSANLATTLGKNGVTIATVEHVLGALCGLGIDNAIIEVNGPEIPILDGSAAPFVFLIREVGTRIQNAPKRFVVVKRPVQVRLAGKAAALFPANEFKISYRVDFDHPMVTDQRFTLGFSASAFQREIARARTFGFVRDLAALKERGLARGGSLDNAIVLDEFRVLNQDGLRYPDEFVRHKILDSMGDLSLFGMPLIGHQVAVCSGHDLNHRVVRKLLATPDAFAVVEAREEKVREHALTLPAFGALEPEAVL